MVSHRRQAFTVIELLIVIAIITVLFSISVPVIVKASDRAAEAQCMSNVRSIIQATTAYTTDNRQRFPGVAPNNAGGTPGTNAFNQLRFLNLVGQPGTLNFSPFQVPAADRPLFDYLNGETSVAECPLDQGSSMAPAFVGTTNFEYFGSSYAYPDRLNYNRIYARYDTWSLEGHKLTRVQQPSKKLVIADNTFFVEGSPEIDQWHEQIDGAQAGSVGFVDGHVAVTPTKAPVPSAIWLAYIVGNGLSTTTPAAVESWAQRDPYY